MSEVPAGIEVTHGPEKGELEQPSVLVVSLETQNDHRHLKVLPDELRKMKVRTAATLETEADRQYVKQLIDNFLEKKRDDPEFQKFFVDLGHVDLSDINLLVLNVVWQNARSGEMSDEKSKSIQNYLRPDRPVLACNVFNDSYARVFDVALEHYGQENHLRDLYKLIPNHPSYALDLRYIGNSNTRHSTLLLVSQRKTFNVTALDPYWSSASASGVFTRETAKSVDYSKNRAADAIRGFLLETNTRGEFGALQRAENLLQAGVDSLSPDQQLLMGMIMKDLLPDLDAVLALYQGSNSRHTLESWVEQDGQTLEQMNQFIQALKDSGQFDEAEEYEQKLRKLTPLLESLQQRYLSKNELERLPNVREQLEEAMRRLTESFFRHLESTPPHMISPEDLLALETFFIHSAVHRISIENSLWERALTISKNALDSYTRFEITEQQKWLIRAKGFSNSLNAGGGAERDQNGFSKDNDIAKERLAELRANIIARLIYMHPTGANNLHGSIEAINPKIEDNLGVRILSNLTDRIGVIDTASLETPEKTAIAALRERLVNKLQSNVLR